MLRARIDRDHALLRALEKELEARTIGIGLTPEEQFEIFGTEKVGGEWAAEAEERWGENKWPGANPNVAPRRTRRRTGRR